MSRQTLKDANFHIIGYIETATDGKQTAKDANFHIVGYYDPKTNQTRDSHFHVIGHENLLASLIHNA